MKKVFACLLLSLSIQIASKAQQLTNKDVPANIRTAVAAKSGGEKTASWVLDKNRRKYIAILESMRLVEVNLEGKWLQTTESLPPSKVPTSVMASIQKEYLTKGYKGSNYERVDDSEKGTFYRADVSSEDDGFHLTLDASGKITKREAE